MKQKLIRPYKERKPENTIKIIKNILNKIELLEAPMIWFNPYNKIFSVRIEAFNEYGNFGTNGKGKTKIYALASAYAEFIERIQNLYHTGSTGFNKKITDYLSDKYKFHYFPDEKIISKEYFTKLPSHIKIDLFNTENTDIVIKKIYNQLKSKNKKGVVGIPFYHINNKEIIYLPYNLLNSLTGSNGMASGNTIAEATFQAICEIYERYSASMIYYDNITPPSIPKTFIEQFPEEFSIINEIERDNKKVIVKDLSCNKRLPVVGVIIVDKKTNKYRLNIGADTCFKVALSRSLTEIFQGIKSEGMEKRFLEFPNKINNPYFYNKNKSKEMELKMINNFRKYITSGIGIFPPSLFNKKPSYKFNPQVFKSRNSYEEEVKYLINLAIDNNIDVYIRDTSILDFPTVYVYMPNLSRWGKKEISSYSNLKLDEQILLTDKLEELILPFQSFINNREHIKTFIKIIKDFNYLGKNSNTFKLKTIFRLKFVKDSVWDTLPLSFLLTLLYYLIEDFSNSIKYLKIFMENKNFDKDGINYYNKVIKFLTLKSKNLVIPEIFYDIINDFSSIENLFKDIGYPNCPDCTACKLTNICLTKHNIKITENINKISTNNIINQNKFILFAKEK